MHRIKWENSCFSKLDDIYKLIILLIIFLFIYNLLYWGSIVLAKCIILKIDIFFIKVQGGLLMSRMFINTRIKGRLDYNIFLMQHLFEFLIFAHFYTQGFLIYSYTQLLDIILYQLLDLILYPAPWYNPIPAPWSNPIPAPWSNPIPSSLI